MNINRLICLAVAVIVTAIQWAPFFSSAIYTQSAQAAVAPVADEALVVVASR